MLYKFFNSLLLRSNVIGALVFKSWIHSEKEAFEPEEAYLFVILEKKAYIHLIISENPCREPGVIAVDVLQTLDLGL